MRRVCVSWPYRSRNVVSSRGLRYFQCRGIASAAPAWAGGIAHSARTVDIAPARRGDMGRPTENWEWATSPGPPSRATPKTPPPSGSPVSEQAPARSGPPDQGPGPPHPGRPQPDRAAPASPPPGRSAGRRTGTGPRNPGSKQTGRCGCRGRKRRRRRESGAPSGGRVALARRESRDIVDGLHRPMDPGPTGLC